jgi:hypothetical protein
MVLSGSGDGVDGLVVDVDWVKQPCRVGQAIALSRKCKGIKKVKAMVLGDALM